MSMLSINPILEKIYIENLYTGPRGLAVLENTLIAIFGFGSKNFLTETENH